MVGSFLTKEAMEKNSWTNPKGKVRQKNELKLLKYLENVNKQADNINQNSGVKPQTDKPSSNR